MFLSGQDNCLLATTSGGYVEKRRSRSKHVNLLSNSSLEFLNAQLANPTPPDPSEPIDPETPPYCDKEEGVCWFIGDNGSSCAETCSNRDGYNGEATLKINEPKACQNILQKLRTPFSNKRVRIGREGAQSGCGFFDQASASINGPWVSNVSPTEDGRYEGLGGLKRVCGCNH